MARRSYREDNGTQLGVVPQACVARVRALFPACSRWCVLSFPFLPTDSVVGRRLIEAMLDNAALENLLGKNRGSLRAGLRWSLQLAGGRTDVRRIELIKLGLVRSFFWQCNGEMREPWLSCAA